MGTPEFAIPSLKILIENDYPIPAVVTAPDKPRGRGREISSTAVKAFAISHGLPVLTPSALKDTLFTEHLKNLNPDLIVVVAFRILPREVFSIPPLGSINLHASLLPRYRGAAPINWAIINGETETGVTTFFLREKVDTGSILLQARTAIKPEDNAGTLHDRLAEIGADVVLHTVRLIEQGKILPRSQDDSQASLAPRIFKEDCQLNWNQSAVRIRDRIRGLSPYPTAYTHHRNRIIKIYRAEVLPIPSSESPGVISVSSGIVRVNTADSLIAITELQLEGRKRMTSKEFLRGYRLDNGEKFQ